MPTARALCARILSDSTDSSPCVSRDTVLPLMRLASRLSDMMAVDLDQPTANMPNAMAVFASGGYENSGSG